MSKAPSRSSRQRDGKVVARLKPEPRKTDWEGFFRRLDEIPPLEDWYIEAIDEIVRERNQPPKDIDWQF